MSKLNEKLRKPDKRSSLKQLQVLYKPWIRKVCKVLQFPYYAILLVIPVGALMGSGPIYNFGNWIFESMDVIPFIAVALIGMACMIYAATSDKNLKACTEIPQTSEKYFEDVRRKALKYYPGIGSPEKLEYVLHMADPIIGTVPLSRKTMEHWKAAREASVEDQGDALRLAYAYAGLDMNKHALGTVVTELERTLFHASEEDMLRAFAAAAVYIPLQTDPVGLERLQRMIVLELWYRYFGEEQPPEPKVKRPEKQNEEDSGAFTPEREKTMPSEGPRITELHTKWIRYAAMNYIDSWSQVEYRLTRSYDYALLRGLLQTAEQMAGRLDKLWTAKTDKALETERTQALRQAGNKVADCPALQEENAIIIAAVSLREVGPVKLVLRTASDTIRILVPAKVEDDLRKKLDDFVENLMEQTIHPKPETKETEKAEPAQQEKQNPEGPQITDLNTRWIEKVAVFPGGFWIRVEYLLTGGYGYNLMLRLMQEAADLANSVERVWTAEMNGLPELDRTEAFKAAGGKFADCPELRQETGLLSAGLVTREIGPVKLVLLNQTRLVRMLVPGQVDDGFRMKMDQYLETLLNRILEDPRDNGFRELRHRCAAAVRENPNSEKALELKKCWV